MSLFELFALRGFAGGGGSGGGSGGSSGGSRMVVHVDFTPDVVTCRENYAFEDIYNAAISDNLVVLAGCINSENGTEVDYYQLVNYYFTTDKHEFGCGVGIECDIGGAGWTAEGFSGEMW